VGSKSLVEICFNFVIKNKIKNKNVILISGFYKVRLENEKPFQSMHPEKALLLPMFQIYEFSIFFAVSSFTSET